MSELQMVSSWELELEYQQHKMESKLEIPKEHWMGKSKVLEWGFQMYM
jgi:hypothetical protein